MKPLTAHFASVAAPAHVNCTRLREMIVLALARAYSAAIADTRGNRSTARRGWVRGLSMVGAILWLFGVFVPAFAQDVETARADLEKAAEQIDLLDPLSIGNAPATSPDVALAPNQAAGIRLAGSNYSASSLISLLSDPSPQVRTLALELLFRKQDPQFLPYIFERSSDNVNTFEHLVYYGFRANGPPASRRDPQTVADFAKASLGFFGVRGDFREFWAARKSRSYWFGWLYSKLSLITGGLPTLNPGVRARLAPFREELERLPDLDRNLYLIWLQCTFTEPALADDAELSEAVRRLGRENVLAIAEGNPPGGDPDLLPSWDVSRYWYTASIVVRHATGVLRREDAPRIAAVVDRERANLKQHGLSDTVISVSYTIAQASLLPERASEILHAEIDRLAGPYHASDRGQLAAALLGLRGAEELNYVRDFFYGEPPTLASGPQAQRALIASLASGDSVLVDTLLDDERTKLLSPGLMAFIYEKFPQLRRKTLVDWFYAQRRDPRKMGNSIEYFLTIMELRNRDHGLMKELLIDPRLDSLPASALLELEQKLSYYRLPPASRTAPLPHLNEIVRCVDADSDCRVSEEAMTELTRFLRAGAEYVDAQHAY